MNKKSSYNITLTRDLSDSFSNNPWPSDWLFCFKLDILQIVIIVSQAWF